MLVVGSKSNLGCEAGCGLTVSSSDHARISLGSSPHWKCTFDPFSEIFSDMLQVSLFVAGAAFGECLNGDT